MGADHSKFLAVRPSSIHGNGLFTTKPLRKGEVIMTVFKSRKVVYLGGYINHQSVPNTHVIKNKNNYDLYALRDIVAGEELTSDYNSMPSFIKNVEQIESEENIIFKT